MGAFLSYLFILGVVAFWVYAGYRVVITSTRRHATLRYVSPLLLLGIALIVYAFFETEAAARLILVWTVPSVLVLGSAAWLIDRLRGRVGQG